MVLARRSRRLTALFALVALLFAQLALAAYVCPAQQEALAMAAMRLAGEPCESGQDALQPVLCHQHATAPAQSPEPAQSPVASLPALLSLTPLVRAADRSALVGPAPPHADAPGGPPPDPLYLATFRLRI